MKSQVHGQTQNLKEVFKDINTSRARDDTKRCEMLQEHCHGNRTSLGMKMPPPCLLGLYRSKQDGSPLVMQYLSFQRYVVFMWCFTDEYKREAGRQQTKN